MIAQIFILLTLSFQSNAHAQGNHHIEADVKQYDTHQVLNFKGQMWPNLKNNQTVNQVLDALEKGKPTTIVIERSGGGYDPLFRKLIRGIKMKCSRDVNNCVLTTISMNVCASNCTDFFLSGDVRIARHTSLFGFHRTWMIHPKLMIRTNKQMSNRYEKKGLNAEWLEQNKHHLFSKHCQTTGCWINGKQALDAGLATELQSVTSANAL